MQLRAMCGRQHSCIGEGRAAAFPAFSGLQMHTAFTQLGQTKKTQNLAKICRLQQASGKGQFSQQIYGDTIKVYQKHAGHFTPARPHWLLTMTEHGAAVLKAKHMDTWLLPVSYQSDRHPSAQVYHWTRLTPQLSDRL